MHYDYPSFAFSLLLLSLLFYFTYYFLFVYLFGCVTQLMGSQFPDQGLNPCLWLWKHRVLTTGPLWNSQFSYLFSLFCILSWRFTTLLSCCKEMIQGNSSPHSPGHLWWFRQCPFGHPQSQNQGYRFTVSASLLFCHGKALLPENQNDDYLLPPPPHRMPPGERGHCTVPGNNFHFLKMTG